MIGPDTAGIGDALKAVLGGAAKNPADVMTASIRLSSDLARIPSTVLNSWIRKPKGDDKAPSDRRFADPAWTDNPYFHAIRLAYLAQCEFARSLVDSSGVDAKQAAKASLGLNLLLDAVAPTNFLVSNPVAMKRAFETAGMSLLRGARNLALDVAQNKGRPRQVDSSAFTVGENLATTPAKVVFRNELMELLQYEPQTDTVHATPLLCSPPWINKYYIMDLAPDRSFIEWAIRHNRTVFAISYRNPTKEMYRTTMDDYLVSGPRQALDVISEVTGSPKIDIAGLCLGGAMTAITAAYLTQSGDDRVGNVTLLNTMLDYSEPGMLGVFTDEAAVDRVEKAMAKAGGTLEGESMAGTFDIMRANDLIFNYVVSNWLLGQDPPAFDILAWNNDSTKMPGRCTRSISGISTSGTCLPRGNSKLRVRRSTSPRSSRTPTWSARRTITSCRGSRRTRPPNCSPEQRDSSSAMAAISLESSTRPARSRGFCPRTTTPPRPTSGCPPLRARPNRGGSTGRSGRPNMRGR